ncbi:hypothetical protein A3H85_03500 [Candidatus Daviesbacteria bacterium RIFCSPLOWO2_02_FULL_40_8]|nr:MAG: hypothetical protein A3C32_00725 [Candidatus Daviesbacteria bacterium RIFCSPHIGHO2_02_FULL_41_14]OGE66992.1 MAG: hypothetical protein A3H85_03500 [Candidatus Daviesbacteria bacterium RIFCSPLOWO2_02_FULL_40_8]
MFLNKLFSKNSPKPVEPDTWFRKVYDTISELELWSKNLGYDEYLQKINEYSKSTSKIPSEQDLQNPADFTRGIFIAINENLIYAGAFDYEYGFDDLFETLTSLFKKANVPFSWKNIKDDSYEYEVDGMKHVLNLSGSDEEDGLEVGSDAFVEIESNINKALEKRKLYLVHTHTGDQTADYVLVKRDLVSKLRDIFPLADDLQLIANNKVQDL